MIQLFATLPATSSNAGVAEASIGPRQDYRVTYDMSGFSDEERKWFVRFLEGTFFADGWQEIAGNILVKLPDEVRLQKQQKLNELGFKIGREWCKDNSIRKINTSMLKKWGHQLKTTAHDEPHLLVDIIDSIDGEVNSLID